MPRVPLATTDFDFFLGFFPSEGPIRGKKINDSDLANDAVVGSFVETDAVFAIELSSNLKGMNWKRLL